VGRTEAARAIEPLCIPFNVVNSIEGGAVISTILVTGATGTIGSALTPAPTSNRRCTTRERGRLRPMPSSI
jgi:hypothetical protein